MLKEYMGFIANSKSVWAEIFILVCAAILLTVSAFWQTRGKFFRLDTDYDQYIPVYAFVTDYLRQYRKLPGWNPYIGTGVPVIADPTSGVLNPLMILPLWIFGVSTGMRIVFVLAILGAGLGMWFLLATLGVRGVVRTWGALIYMFSGSVIARIAAGHLEQIWSSGIFAVFLALALRRQLTPVRLVLIAGTITWLIFCGDFYRALFAVMFLIFIRVGYAVSERKKMISELAAILMILLLTSFLGSVKILPFIQNVAPQLVRYFPIDPFAGSLHAVLTPLVFIVPGQVSFYDDWTFFRRLFGLSYNWYEYYAFITPIVLFFLVFLPKVWLKTRVRLLIGLFIFGSLYVALKYPYSPFYWLYRWVPSLTAFRTNQRMFLVLTPAVVALAALGAQVWWRKNKQRGLVLLLFSSSVIWLFWISQQTLVGVFEPARSKETKLVKELRDRDPGQYFVVTNVCCLQTALVAAKIPVLNYYYGWRPASTPGFLYFDGSGFDYDRLHIIRPRYVIAPDSADLGKYFYEKIISEKHMIVWMTERENVKPNMRYEL